MQKKLKTTFFLFLALLLALPVQSSTGWIFEPILTYFGYSHKVEQEELLSEEEIKLCNELLVQNQAQQDTGHNSQNLHLARVLCISYNALQNSKNSATIEPLDAIKKALAKLKYKPLFALDGSLADLLDTEGVFVFSSSAHSQQKNWLWDSFLPGLYQKRLAISAIGSAVFCGLVGWYGYKFFRK